MFHREVITDQPDDKESCYHCDCGFGHSEGGAVGVYLSETCGCNTCRSYTLPLKFCPLCGEPVTVKE